MCASPSVGLPGCGPSRLWAFPVVGPPGFGPSQLRAFPFVGQLVCRPSRFRDLCCWPSRLLLLRDIPQASIWVSFLVDSRCVFSTARRALPAPVFGGRPVCSGRAECCCPLCWLSCQIFFGRAPVAFSRRFPFRRHFLDRCPFSWTYARLFGPADVSCPLSLLSWPFFVERTPGAFSRHVFWANALLPAWMNEWTLVKLDAQ